MNALQTLKDFCDHWQNTKHWIQPRFANPSAISMMSESIQLCALKLKELEAERIKDLQDNGPKATGTPGDVTVTLLRDGKEKHIEFGEYNLRLSKTNKEEAIKTFKLDGPPDDEGMTHFIEACPGDWGQMPWGAWITKEESAKLTKQLAEIYKDEEDDDYYFREDSRCTFCGYVESQCGGDHGDEMRDIQREAMRGSRW